MLLQVMLASALAAPADEIWSTPIQDRPPLTHAVGLTWRSSFGPTTLHAPELYAGLSLVRGARISGGLALRVAAVGVVVPAEERSFWNFGTAELSGVMTVHGPAGRADHGIAAAVGVGLGGSNAYWTRRHDTSVSATLRYTPYVRVHERVHLAGQFEVAGAPANFPSYVDVAGGLALVVLPLPELSVQVGFQGGLESVNTVSIGLAGRPVQGLEIGLRWYVPTFAGTTYVRPALEIKGWWEKPRLAEG